MSTSIQSNSNPSPIIISSSKSPSLNDSSSNGSLSSLFQERTNPIEKKESVSPLYSVIGFGTPCVDSVYKVTDLFLQKFSLEKGNWKQVLNWGEFSNILDKAIIENSTFSDQKVTRIGGSSSNTIKALARLQNNTAFFGKLGQFKEDQFYRSSVNNLNVHLLEQPSSNPITQIAVFVTPDHQRTFVAYPNLSTDLSLETLSKEIFEKAKLAHFEGYMLKEFSFPFIKKAMQLAQEAGAKVSFDLGCGFITEHYRENILELLENVDIVFANQDEVKALFNKESDEEAAPLLFSKCPIAVFLKGKEGALISDRNLGQVIESPAINVEVQDTTGAGDFFAGGFLHGYLQNCSLEECGRLGNLLGGTVVTFEGAEIPEEKWPLLIQEVENQEEANL